MSIAEPSNIIYIHVAMEIWCNQETRIQKIMIIPALQEEQEGYGS